MIGFMHRDASDANQRQSSQQDQFGRVVHHAVKDIDIYRAPRDQRTRPLAASAIIVRLQPASSYRWSTERVPDFKISGTSGESFDHELDDEVNNLHTRSRGGALM
jgi:hypothetical protein